MNARHPMKRVGMPEDIANVASFLLNDESSWITGQVLGVDGGISTLNVNQYAFAKAYQFTHIISTSFDKEYKYDGDSYTPERECVFEKPMYQRLIF